MFHRTQHHIFLFVIILSFIIQYVSAYTYYRLPKNVLPELYKLKILTHLNDSDGFKYTGEVTIYTSISSSDDFVQNITLHTKNLTIDEKGITIEKLIDNNNNNNNNSSNSSNKNINDAVEDDDVDDTKTMYNVTNIEMIPEYDYMILYLNEPLYDGEKFKIIILFKGELNTNLNGYYRSSYTDKKTKEKRWIAITHFEPTSARQAFPCFDEPDMKAKFQITLGHDKKYMAISNTPLKKTTEIPYKSRNNYYHENYEQYFNDCINKYNRYFIKNNQLLNAENIYHTIKNILINHKLFRSNKSGWVWDHFEETVPMSTYLVAYSVNDFGYKESKVDMKSDNILFRTWARNDALSQVNYASEIGPKVLKFYENYFNTKFPLPKIDEIAIPDFSAGAMENWGLITYRETALLYDQNRSSSTSKHRVASVISHELAHQWFGNLVTMKWWTDIWLNEGFATYVASLGVHHVHPEWDSYKEESVDNTLSVFKIDALKSSHPISVKIENPKDINQIFDSISYDKGSCVLRMMHLFLGEETFRLGITNYLKEYQYKNAEQDDLWSTLTTAAHDLQTIPDTYTVKEIMDSWTLQTGYPIVNVIRDYTTGGAIVTQSRYLLDTSFQRNNNLENCWWIPLSYTKQSTNDFNNTRPLRWLECNGKEVIPISMDYLAAQNEWVIFNIQLSGLYKVKYDEKNWDLIIDELKNDHSKIHVLNRAQLIDDSMDLAWIGDQDYSIAMRMMEYLKLERDYIPWKAALSNLNAVNRMLRRTSQYDFFKKYIRKILTPIYEALGGLTISKVSTDSDRLDAVKRKVLIMSWSCRFDVGNCIPDAKEYFKKWQNSENPDQVNPIPLDLRSVIYCTAMRNGNENEWNFLWDRYNASNVASEKQTILSALGCSREIWIIQRYLEWCFNESSGIRKQDSIIVFGAIAREEVGFHLAKDYLINNIDMIYKYYDPETSRLGRLISPIANQMNTETDLNTMKEFIDKYKSYFEKASRGIERSLENININSQWKIRNYDNFSRQLQKYL